MTTLIKTWCIKSRGLSAEQEGPLKPEVVVVLHEFS